MVVVGGITRLTESGLSITEWKPITGALPPLSEADWLSEFTKYQQIPEYREISGPAGMTLADFKFIYFWEWVHRLLGRLIGVAFALPLLWFAVKRAIPSGYAMRLVALLALGGLQGTIGWWMVSSGLSERTDVSHFRLAVLMNEYFVPGGINWAEGVWAALNNDPYLIHFIHRWWAWVVVGFLVVLARKVRPLNRRSSVAIHIAFGSQILLGIATVLTGIDIHLAVLHQAVGALVVAATVWGVHELGRAPR